MLLSMVIGWLSNNSYVLYKSELHSLVEAGEKLQEPFCSGTMTGAACAIVGELASVLTSDVDKRMRRSTMF